MLFRSAEYSSTTSDGYGISFRTVATLGEKQKGTSLKLKLNLKLRYSLILNLTVRLEFELKVKFNAHLNSEKR